MSIKDFYKVQNKIVDRTWRHQSTYPVLPNQKTEFVCIKGIIERTDLQEEYNYFEFVSKNAIEHRLIRARDRLAYSFEELKNAF